METTHTHSVSGKARTYPKPFGAELPDGEVYAHHTDGVLCNDFEAGCILIVSDGLIEWRTKNLGGFVAQVGDEHVAEVLGYTHSILGHSTQLRLTRAEPIEGEFVQLNIDFEA